ncbi:hypothetical protein [Saccharopolyspora phatthalungensis]|uniref:Uncharacterized protein n=1 Tax=Saccharopolyspora phatthalungensis TaxID=664693 RepID=A0A840QBF2_9PSEU|nr:hypothetical protein [Saccharopolyspora phatthalungensis]MBB5158084.1 hypothetical protein [Saccharopolyspora phatthalungensis]
MPDTNVIRLALARNAWNFRSPAGHLELIDLGPGSNVRPVGALRHADRPEIISLAPGHFAGESVFPSNRCHFGPDLGRLFSLDVTGSYPKPSARRRQADFRVGWTDFFAFAERASRVRAAAGYLVTSFFLGLFLVLAEWVLGPISLAH